MNTWFTSDLHIGHKLVAGFRGFDVTNEHGETRIDVDEHDRYLAEVWNSAIKPDDVVWVLGDVSLNPDRGIAWIASVNGRKHLIAGNHDRCHPSFRDSHKHQKEYLEVFESVQTMARQKFVIGGSQDKGTIVFLSHFPYSADSQSEERASQYRLRDEGELLLHGHTHSDVIFTSDREIHVGWDAWQRPISRKEIETCLTVLVDKRQALC